MALTTEQKVDLLLKKLGYTKTKTGSVFGTGAVSGTGKQPFGEAIPSPLIVANGSLWNESDSIPATPPGSDTNQVKRYPTTSALRMTLDTTVTPNRSFIAYTTYNNSSSARLTNWIDTQFGPDYQLEVYVDDATDPANKLPEGGSGSNDGWYFDYSAGVLNFSDTNLPSGVNGAGTNVYIVGYRYVGQTGAPTPGISTYSFLDLTVERNLDVGNQGGISTFRNGINALDIIKGYKYTAAPYSGTTTTLNVTVASKVSGEHRYHGQGSGLGYVIDGLQSPFFTLTPGRTYRFDQSDNSNNNHQIKFYLESDKTTLYEEGVTYNGSAGTAGAYTQIVVSDKTPVVLHYQCVNHGYMGNAFQTNANVVNTNHEATLRGGLNVTGVSTFSSLVDINAGGQANTFKVEDLTDNRIVIAGSGGELEDSANLTFNGTTLGVTGDASFSGNVSIGGTLTYEDVINVDSVGIITARAGIDVTGGVIEALAGENKIPSLYANMAALPNAGTYHGMFAHVHSQGKGYFAHGGAWYELVNKELNGTVGVGTEVYNIGVTSISTLNVLGVSTFAGNVDINADIDVDGHTNLDNVNVSGVTTFAGIIEGIAGENKIPSLYSDIPSLPNAGTYHGMFAHVHATGRGYFSHAGGWYELVNKESNGTVGTGTETYNIGSLTATGIDLNGDIDVDGHTNLDNVSIAGVTTTAGLLDINAGGQANTFKVEDLTSGRVVLAGTGGELEDTNDLRFDGTDLYVSGIRVGSGGGGIIGDDIITRNLKANGISTFIGIATFNNATFHDDVTFNGDIDVDGHTNLDNISVAGVTTFAGDINVDGDTVLDRLFVDESARFNSTIAVHDGTTGSNGQYLKSIGTGVTWASFPTLRTRDTVTASAGQTVFTFDYTVNFIDVYVNGIKLTDSEFTATNGTSVVLAVGCFVGDIVELVSFNTVSTGAGGGGGSLNNIVEDTTPQLGGNLDLFNKTIEGTGGINITGVITATNFIGDGSGLTGITASGSGVIVRDDNNLIGTASTINFADNLSVTPISAGIVTVSADFSTPLVVSGSSTFTGITSIKNTAHFSYDSNADINKKFWFWGNGTDRYVVFRRENINSPALNFSDISRLTFGDNQHTDLTHSGSAFTWRQYTTANDNPFIIHSDFTNIKGSPTSSHNTRSIADFTFKDGCELYYTGTKRLQTSGIGITVTGSIDASGDLDVDGHTNLDNVSIAGVVTATTFVGAIQGTSGTFSSNVDITGDLDVDRHTNLDNVSVAGVSTFSDQSFLNDIVNIMNGLRLQTNGNLTIIDSTSSGGIDIQNNTSIQLSQNGFPNRDYAVFSDGGATLYRGGNQSLSDSSSGWTFYNHILPNTNNTYDLGTSSKKFRQLHVTNINAGVVTATSFVGDGSGLTNVSSSGISTTNLRADTLVVGENTTGISTFHRVHIPTNKLFSFGDTNQASIYYPTGNYLYLYGGTEGDMVIQTGGNKAIKIEASGNFEVDTGGNEIAIKATKDGPVELYQNGYAAPEGLRFATTGVGVTVIGITSMTDNLMVGTAATITPAGAAQFAGIVTAASFIGDGSGLTGITASGSGVIIKEDDTLVGTVGSINFVGVDVSPASAGIVTVSTATTSITDGNSKLFVNNESSSNGNGSFEVLLNDFSYSGSREVLNMHQPTDGYCRVDLHHGTTPTTVEVNAKTVYSGYARHRLKFETTNASYGGQLDFIASIGQWSFNSTYQGSNKAILNLNYNSIGVGDDVYPTTNDAFDLGFSNFKFRQFHATGVNAGVVTATTLKGAVQATSGTFSSNVDVTGDLDVDGHTNLDNVSIAGVATVGNLTVSGNSLQAVNGTFSNNITANQATFGGNITGPLLSISPGSGNDGIILLNSAGGQNNDFSRIRQDISDDTFKIENKASGSYESLFEGTGNAGVKLFFSGNEKLETTNAGAVVTGILTATSFVGDGSQLTGISGSGGVTVQDEGSTLSTQATTLNFVGSGVVASGTGATKTITINTGSGGVSLTGSTNNQLVTVTGANAITGESNLTFDGSTLDVNGGITANTIDLETNGLNLTSSYNIGVSALGLYINNTGNTLSIASFQFSSGCRLMDTNGSTRLATTTSGVNVTGTLTADGFDGSVKVVAANSVAATVYPVFAGSGATQSGILDLKTDNSFYYNSQSGELTAVKFTGDGSGLTSLPAPTPTTSDIQVTYEITNQTSFSYYRFAGNGVDSSANNPDIYLERGQKYRFINNSGGTSHPFEIQTTGGSAYNTGVTNNGASTGSASKNIDFAVSWDAPDHLKYQCQNHGSMQGNIYIINHNSPGTITSSSSSVTVNTTPVGSCSAVEYTIFVSNGSNIQTQKALIMDNGTTAYIQEFAVMSNPNLIVTFTADVNSGNVRLLATKESGISGSVTYKFSKMIIQ